MIDIVTQSGKFFSQKDEYYLFEWLNSIDGIENIRGVGSELLIAINDNIDDDSLLELIAIVCRYDLGIKDIKDKFGVINKYKWINNKKMFWNKLS